MIRHGARQKIEVDERVRYLHFGNDVTAVRKTSGSGENQCRKIRDVNLRGQSVNANSLCSTLIKMTAQKAGGGSSSGLGAFWKTELAKNPDLSLPARMKLGPTDANCPESETCLRPSEVSQRDNSSSKDIWKTPSLGTRRWRDGEGGEAPTRPPKWVRCDFTNGAVRGPSNSPCHALSRVGVVGREVSSTSVVSSQIGNSAEAPLEVSFVWRNDEPEWLGAERERERRLCGALDRGTGTGRAAGVGVVGFLRRASFPEGRADINLGGVTLAGEDTTRVRE